MLTCALICVLAGVYGVTRSGAGHTNGPAVWRRRGLWERKRRVQGTNMYHVCVQMQYGMDFSRDVRHRMPIVPIVPIAERRRRSSPRTLSFTRQPRPRRVFASNARMRVCARTRTPARLHACACTHAHTHTHTRTRTCTHARKRTHAHTQHEQIRIHLPPYATRIFTLTPDFGKEAEAPQGMCVCVCVCVCVCLCLSVYTWSHTL